MLSMLLLLFLQASHANPLWPSVSTPLKEASPTRKKDAALTIAIGDYDLAPDIAGAKKNGQDWYLQLIRT